MCTTVDRHASAIESVRLGLEVFPGHDELTKVLNELITHQIPPEDGSLPRQQRAVASDVAEESNAVQGALEETGGDRPMSQSFADLVVRGRQLFRALPREEREDVYKVLTHGNRY